MSVVVAPLSAQVLVFGEGKLFGRDEYSASGVAVWVTADTVVLKGFVGDLTKEDMRAIADTFRRAGASYLQAERLEGHSLPLGKRIRQTAANLHLWEIAL